MKNKLTLLFFSFLMICFYTNLNAQSYIGIEGGGYIAPGETGLKIGIVSDFKIKKFLSFHPELIYIQKGVSLPLENLSNEITYRSPKVDYIQIPIMFNFSLDMNTLSFQIFAGPYISYGLKASAINIEDINNPYKEIFTFEDINTHRLDFGASFGTSLVLEIAKAKKMFLDLRYNLGLRDINADPVGSTFNEGTSLTMGFMIPLKRKEE